MSNYEETELSSNKVIEKGYCMSNCEENELSSNKIMTFAEVAEAAGISLSTLQRQIAGGNGPKVVFLSTRRKGIRIVEYRRWLDSRTSLTRESI